MPLPVGFKVNGSEVSDSRNIPATPRAKKIMAVLDALSFGELKTTVAVASLLHVSCIDYHPSLSDYREIVDGHALWGSQKSIAQLRIRLAEITEGSNV